MILIYFLPEKYKADYKLDLHAMIVVSLLDCELKNNFLNEQWVKVENKDDLC